MFTDFISECKSHKLGMELASELNTTKSVPLMTAADVSQPQVAVGVTA